MEQTEILVEVPQTQLPPLGKVVRTPKPNTKHVPIQRMIHMGAVWCVVFFWSKVEVLQLLHPLAAAVLSVFFGKSTFWFFGSAALLGGWGTGDVLKHVAVILAASLVQLTLTHFGTSTRQKALYGAFSLLLGGCFYAIGQGGLRFYFALAVVESILVFGISILLQKGMQLLLTHSRTHIWSREETLSVLLVLSGALCGSASISLFDIQYRLFPFLMTLFLLVTATREGVGGGAAAGVLLGFLLYLCGFSEPSVFLLLSIGGLFAGCLKELGRFASVCGLLLTAIFLLFYTDTDVIQPMWLLFMALGCMVFLCLPKRLLSGMGSVWQTTVSQDKYTQMKTELEQTLHQCANAFHALSKAYTVEPHTQNNNLSELVEQTAQTVCKGCSLHTYCWKEEVYRTYGMTVNLFSHCDTNGTLHVNVFPQWFQEICPRITSYKDTVTVLHERHRLDGIWTNRLQECRQLVGEQLHAVGDILQTLSTQSPKEETICTAEQKEILTQCQRMNIMVEQVSVIEEPQYMRVSLYVKNCHMRDQCQQILLPLVQKVVGRTMIQQQNHCHTQQNFCHVTFVEPPKYAVTVSTACIAGKTDDVCGDHCAYIESKRGIALLAVSDGMGMGEQAAIESKDAIELLEEFAQAGFSEEIAISLINSALLLRRAEESYATLDICTIDLYSGQSSFLKLGAVASYICRGTRVLSIYAHTLPAGILQQVHVLKHTVRLQHGDLLLMMTDGITDAFGGQQQTAIWLEEHFLPHGFANPKDAADFVLQNARQQKSAQPDDMTVQAVRIWEKH